MAFNPKLSLFESRMSNPFSQKSLKRDAALDKRPSISSIPKSMSSRHSMRRDAVSNAVVTQAVLLSMMQEYTALKTQAAEMQLRKAKRFAASLISLGCINLAIGRLASYKLRWVLDPLGHTLVVSAIIVLTALPVDQIDLDSMAKDYPKARSVLHFVLFLLSVMLTRHPPYYQHVPACVCALWMLLGGKRVYVLKSPRWTTLFGIWGLATLLAYYPMRKGIGAGLTDKATNDQLLVLVGFVAPPLIAMVWGWSRRRHISNGGSKGTSPMLAFFYVIHSFMLVYGLCSCLQALSFDTQPFEGTITWEHAATSEAGHLKMVKNTWYSINCNNYTLTVGVTDKKFTFPQCEEVCESGNGTLIRFTKDNDECLQLPLETLLPKPTTAYIGFYRTSQGQWNWVSEEASIQDSWTNWLPEKPDNMQGFMEDCADMRTKNDRKGWDDVGCAYRKRCLCQQGGFPSNKYKAERTRLNTYIKQSTALQVGIIWLLAPLMVCLVGRGRLYRSISRHFDGNKSKMQNYGAFIAHLYDSYSHKVHMGQPWWIHRSEGEKDHAYAPTDHRHHWREGRVVEVSEVTKSVTVKLLADAHIHKKISKRKSLADTHTHKKTSTRKSLADAHTHKKTSKNNSLRLKEPSTVTTEAQLGAGTSPGLQANSLALALQWRERSRGALQKRVYEFPLQQHFQGKKELLKSCVTNLRCIDWLDMTPELMASSTSVPNATTCANGTKQPDGAMQSLSLPTSLFQLSRPLKAGETIDFFMSHSWRDDAAAKYVQLQEVASKFFKVHKRYPTFWLDKVCIDQSNIPDGLRALPVNVMACSKMLVLFGPTYATRLWCIWELFTLFSFIPAKDIYKHLQLHFIGRQSEFSFLNQVDYLNASCYDPNEETRLKSIIEQVGGAVFNDRLRELTAEMLLEMVSGSSNSDSDDNSSSEDGLVSTSDIGVDMV